MSATRIETTLGEAKDVRVYEVDGEVRWRDRYGRHTLTLDADDSERLGRALLAGATMLRDQPKGKR